MTLWSMLKETFTFKNDENQALRDARAEVRLENQSQAVDVELQTAEVSHDLHKVEVAMKKIKTLDEKKAFRLFDQLVRVRLLTSKQLQRLSYIEQMIQRDPELSEDERKAIVAKLEIDRKHISNIIETVFREETSFNSLNTSLLQLLNTQSQARNLYFNYLKVKRTTKPTNRDEKGLTKKASSVNPKNENLFKKRIELFDEHLNKELAYLFKATANTIQLLQSDRHDLQAKKQHMEQLIAEAGFPKNIGTPIVKSLDETLFSVHELLQEEIAKKRIEMSNAKR